MPEQTRLQKIVNHKIILETAIVNVIDLTKDDITTTRKSFILTKGNNSFISTGYLNDDDFKTIASMHPRDIINQVFIYNDEAMDLLREAKAQGGLFYRTEFIRI